MLERRLDEALGGGGAHAEDRADVTVLLVGRGSTDPDANAEVHKAARLLWEGRGYAGVETAFVSLAAPDVPSGLDRCVEARARGGSWSCRTSCSPGSCRTGCGSRRRAGRRPTRRSRCGPPT